MIQRLALAATDAPADFEEASILFVGAATVILRYGGFTVLVDPTFLHHGDHVHLGYDLRASGVASAVEQLPPPDFVLLPQLHDGRPDRAVDHELARRLPVLTTRGAASTLRQKGFVAARGLASWETIRVERAEAAVRVTAVPARRPVSLESFLPDAMGSVLEFAREGEAVRLRVYVSGDSVIHGDLREIPRRHPGVDLALLPVGGTRVLGVLAATEEGAGTARLVGPRTMRPVPGENHGLESPLEEFAAEMRRAGLEARVDYVAPGRACVFRPKALGAAPGIPPQELSRSPVDALSAPDGDRPVAA